MQSVQQVVFHADSDEEPHEVPSQLEQLERKDFKGRLLNLWEGDQERECF